MSVLSDIESVGKGTYEMITCFCYTINTLSVETGSKISFLDGQSFIVL